MKYRVDWISVKEQMPPPREWVMVALERYIDPEFDSGFEFSWVDEDGYWGQYHLNGRRGDGKESHIVTHWAHLPTKP